MIIVNITAYETGNTGIVISNSIAVTINTMVTITNIILFASNPLSYYVALNIVADVRNTFPIP